MKPLTNQLRATFLRRIEAMSKELNELRNQSLKPGAASTTSTDDSGLSADPAGRSPSAIPADEFDLSVKAVEIGSVIISAEVAIEAFRM